MRAEDAAKHKKLEELHADPATWKKGEREVGELVGCSRAAVNRFRRRAKGLPGHSVPAGPKVIIKLTPAEESALVAYLDSLKGKLDRGKVGKKALLALLEAEGFWPRKR